MSTFMKGNVIFVSLPGHWFSKSIIYAILPHAFDSTDMTLSRDKAHVMYYGYHDRC